MSNQTTEKINTEAYLTIQAWKDAAREAGLVLQSKDEGQDSGDFPDRPYNSLRRFRSIMALSKGEPKRVVTHMARQLISERDEKGKPVKKEYLTWSGYYEVTDYRGVPYHADLDVGKYNKPKIVANPNIRYNPKTGEPVGPEKILSGSDTIYTIEVPKGKTERKKLIDEIIGNDNFPEEIHYYYKGYYELPRRDSTFSYDDFVSYSIEEMRKMSFQGGGSKTPGIWRDKDGKIRDKNGNLV